MKKTTYEPPAMGLRRGRRIYADGQGITQRQASELAGVTIGTIRKYERARKLPEAVMILFRLARAYRLPLDTIVADFIDKPVTDEIEARRSELDVRDA